MKSSAKIKLYSPMILALLFLTISIVLIIITFSLVYWLQVKSTSDNYGMWQGCKNASFSNQCLSWYANGQTLLSYTMTDSYKAFQGLQVGFLAFSIFAFTLLLVILMFCMKRYWLYVITGLVLFVATACGIASLLVFIINVYTPATLYLSWCYWVSVAAVILDILVLLLLVLFAIQMKRRPIETPRLELIKQFDSKTVISQKETIETEKQEKVVKEISQAPNPSTPKVVRIIKTTGLQEAESNLPNHTHYHSEYDLTRPKSKGPNYRRRFNYRQIHKVNESKKSKRYTEQFQPGYCSEPEIIEYSLDRCWINLDNSIPVSFETIEKVSYDDLNMNRVFSKAL